MEQSMHFNFELILFYAILISGGIVLLDSLFWAKKRRLAPLIGHGVAPKTPVLIDYARSFFPILLVVFLLRSFLYEPFRIPTGSLEPTLLVGDFILVNKFDYGIRLPIIHKKIIHLHTPQRGDIVVFRWPPDPSVDFIKRVVGVPGDHLTYINKVLYVNGEKAAQTDLSNGALSYDADDNVSVTLKSENLLGVTHQIYQNPDKPDDNFYDVIVPKDMYFMMGDNRDDSADSRFWGFVPDANIVGKASMVWMSWNKLSYHIRWDRLGKLIH